MRITLAKNYFSKLINATVDEYTVIKLSSGQGARAHAWLKTNNFNIKNLNLSSGFTIAKLMDSEHSLSDGELRHEVATPHLVASSELNNPIGVDIQSVSELFPLGMPSDPKSDPELLSIYTFKELSYAETRPNPLQTLTGLFAAKEAILKCSTNESSLANLEILPDLTGRPNIEGYSVSISHSQDFAVAIATSNFSINKNRDINLKDKDQECKLASASAVERKHFKDYIIFAVVLGLFIVEILRFLR